MAQDSDWHNQDVAAASSFFAPPVITKVFERQMTGNNGEDHHGKPRQVEFTSEGAEYYVAATGEEGAVAPEAVAELVRKLAG